MSRVVFLALAIPLGGMVYNAAHYALWLLAGRPRGVEQLAADIFKRWSARLAT